MVRGRNMPYPSSTEEHARSSTFEPCTGHSTTGAEIILLVAVSGYVACIRCFGSSIERESPLGNLQKLVNKAIESSKRGDSARFRFSTGLLLSHEDFRCCGRFRWC